MFGTQSAYHYDSISLRERYMFPRVLAACLVVSALLYVPPRIPGLSSVPRGHGGIGQASAESASAPGGAPRLALLVGIGNYPQNGKRPWPRLYTHKEITDLATLLVRHYQFKSEDIQILEDERATAAAIRTAFHSHLIGRARPGAIVFFHFSGHGQQIADQEGELGDEQDGLDESLVPYDAREQDATSGAVSNLRDDELAQWIDALDRRLRSHGGRQGDIVVSLDACFAGGSTRGGLVGRGRGWDLTLDGPQPPRRQLQRGGIQAGARGLDHSGDYHLLAASMEGERARERGEMGLFSAALLQALKHADGATNYYELMDEISTRLAQWTHGAQTPILYGSGRDPVLSGSGPGRAAYIPVFADGAGVVRLAAGRLQLLELGTLVEIHRRGSEPMSPATLLDRAEVFEITSASSQARLHHGALTAPAPLQGARARLLRPSRIQPPLRIAISETVQGAALRAALASSEFAQQVPGADPDFHLRIDAQDDAWQLRRANQLEPLLRVTPDRIGLLRIQTALAAQWRFQQLLSLQHSDPFIPVSLRLVPVSVQVEPDGLVHQTPQPCAGREASQYLHLYENDFYVFELRNESFNPYHVHILELTPDGQTLHHYPRSDDPTRGFIPAGFRRTLPLPHVYRAGPPLGRSVFKVIATSQYVDLSALASDGIRGPAQRLGSIVGRHALQSLLRLDPGGVKVRGDPGVPASVPATAVAPHSANEDGDWSVSTAFLTLFPVPPTPASAKPPALGHCREVP